MSVTGPKPRSPSSIKIPTKRTSGGHHVCHALNDACKTGCGSETDFKILTLSFRRHTLHITSKTNINNDYTCAVIYKNQMLLFASWLQYIPFRDR